MSVLVFGYMFFLFFSFFFWNTISIIYQKDFGGSRWTWEFELKNAFLIVFSNHVIVVDFWVRGGESGHWEV